MVFHKKKNIVIVSLIAAVVFFIYQVYFLFTFISENPAKSIVLLENKVRHDYERKIKDLKYVHSEADKYLNEHGIIRGVSKSNMLRYRPNSENEFECLNLEQKIPFDWVNDDYCDCEDGSDEPSTSGCPNGVFQCERQRPKLVSTLPSSRVNDGICDCCDGSDEWESRTSLTHFASISSNIKVHAANCPNIC